MPLDGKIAPGEKRIVTAQFHKLIPAGVTILGTPTVLPEPATGVTITGTLVDGSDVRFFVELAEDITATKIALIVEALLTDGQEVQCRDEDNEPIYIEVA